jgi:uncharacterized protein involved in response to NO
MVNDAWRREPYRLLFPLGALLAWAGVLHWFLQSLGLIEHPHAVFHSIAQVQGFLMCFAVGFLFTAIPRRTGTPPAAAWEMAVALIAPVATTVAAWYERWALSQAFWMALVVTLAVFAVRRFLSARAARRPPNSFVWVPLSLATGVFGSILIGVGGATENFSLHDLGKTILLQGMFLGLVCGVGGMVLPLIARGEAPPDAAATSRDHLERAVHVGAWALLLATFWVENLATPRVGALLRGAVVLAVLLWSGRIGQRPSVPGTHRRLVWLSAWMVPAGYFWAALYPLQHKAGLHIVFIGGFALMCFAVGTHVSLAHGGYQRLVRGHPWQVRAYGTLLLAAMVVRLFVDADRQHFLKWVGVSSFLFLTASLAWGWLLARTLLVPPGPEQSAP